MECILFLDFNIVTTFYILHVPFPSPLRLLPLDPGGDGVADLLPSEIGGNMCTMARPAICLSTVHIFLKISKRNSPCCSLISLKSSRVIWRSRRPSRSWKLSTILCVASESILYSSATYSNHRVNSTDVQLLGCKAAQRGRESLSSLTTIFKIAYEPRYHTRFFRRKNYQYITIQWQSRTNAFLSA